ncbi:MAG: TolC family protein [Muribaculaceae bacterium]
MAKRICRIMALLMALCSEVVSGQAVHKTLSVADMFSLAEKNNATMRRSTALVDVAEAKVAESKVQRLPEISAMLSLSYNDTGRVMDRDFSNSISAEIPAFGNAFQLEVSQPLYTGGAISSGINLSLLEKEMALLDQAKSAQEVRYGLIECYLSLLKLNNSEQVLRSNIALTEDLIEKARVQVVQGTILKNDVTRYELHLKTQQLQLATLQGARNVINRKLCIELGLGDDVMIEPDSTVTTCEFQPKSCSEWQTLAMQESQGIRQSALAVQMSLEQEKLSRSERLPHVALVAADVLNGPITIEVPPINKNINYWYVGVAVNYNISALYKNNKRMRRARLATRYAQEQKQEVVEGVEKAMFAEYTNLQTAMVNLSTRTKNVELALQNYEVTRNRYENGIALLTDMVDAANVRLDAELALVNSRIEVLLCYYRMKYLAGVL